MGLSDFFDSTFRRLMERPGNVRTDQNSFRLKELPYEVVFPSHSFCPDIYHINLQLRHYLSYSFAPPHAAYLEYMCFVRTQNVDRMQSETVSQIVEYLKRAYSDITNRAIKFGSIDANFEIEMFSEMVESFITIHCYDILFCSSDEEETIDISIQDRIRSLFWVTQGFLDINIDLESKTVEDLIHEAIIEILKLDSYRKMKDKFECLIECANKISKAIKESTKSHVSADEFIPVLIYVIIRANPPRIISNINFMQRYSLEFRTIRGEAAYQFTNFCSAIEFIQKINAKSINISEKAFCSFVIDYSRS